ncbi:MAG: outer membrane beta-barrel protein [Flavihumibacter sp.]
MQATAENSNNREQQQLKTAITENSNNRKQQQSPETGGPTQHIAERNKFYAKKANATPYTVADLYENETELPAGPSPYLAAYLNPAAPAEVKAAKIARPAAPALSTRAAVQQLTKARYRKWEYAFDLKAGYSSLQNSLFDKFRSSTPEYQASYAAPGPTNMAAPQVNLNFVQRKPSVVKAGPAFMAQYQVSRLLSKQLRLGLGLQYAVSSNEIRFGAVLDSAAAMTGNQFLFAIEARPGSSIKTNDFRNVFHSVRVPVELSWNFDKKERWFLNSGVSFGVLAGTDAYQVSNFSGYYYRDDQRFNKFQAALFTGVYYTLQPHSRLPLSVGPTVQYDLGNISNTGDGRKMLFLGVGARVKLRPGP